MTCLLCLSWSKLLCDGDNPRDCDVLRVKLMLGNMEELRDYHKHVMLPKMETAVDNAVIMR